MEFLRRSLRWLAARQPGQPIRSVETGFALGYSALAVVGAACNAGIHLKHSAMDPYQGAAWRGVGQKRLQCLVGTCASDEVNFELLELPASIGLARMVAGGECVQLGYMDDGHKFDDNMIELALINSMMPAGGILVIDDTLMPSVAATISYIEANLPYERITINERFVAFVKQRKDVRAWNHYGPFDASFNRSDGAGRRHIASSLGVAHRGLRGAAV